jgi:hypothetical protein
MQSAFAGGQSADLSNRADCVNQPSTRAARVELDMMASRPKT